MSFWEVAAPTWLQGVGTVGAFTTGGVILLRELRKDRGQQEVQERKQAAAVSAWLIRSDSDTAAGRVVARCVLSNAAESPVYDLKVHYASGGNAVITDAVDVLPPGRVERRLPERYDELWIKGAGGWLRSKSSSDAVVADPHQEAWPCQISLVFRDAAGVRWQRDVDGTLSKM